MISYPYHCNICKHDFTSEYPMGEAQDRTPCPFCGQPSPRVYEPVDTHWVGYKPSYTAPGTSKAERQEKLAKDLAEGKDPLNRYL